MREELDRAKGRAGAINATVNPAIDPISGQPELKHTPVEIRRLDMRWHGTILARRPVMLPEITYWAPARGAGYHTYLLAGEQAVGIAQQALSSAVRATNPGPWLAGEQGVAAVIADGRLEAVLVLGPSHRGGEVCACFGVSMAAVTGAIDKGAVKAA